MFAVDALPDPDWYLDNVLVHAEPGRADPIVVSAQAQWQTSWRQWAREHRSDVEQLAAGHGFVVTTAQLRQCGWARHDLRREVRRGRWSVPAPGCAAPLAWPADDDRFDTRRRRHALACAAATLRRRDQVVGARSAAALHGLPTMALPVLPQLAVRSAEPTLGVRDAAHVFRAALADAEVSTWFGVPVTAVARTVADLARHDRRDGLMAADAALRAGLCDLAALHRAVDRAAGWPGVRGAREVAAWASPLAESPLESLVRLAILDDGMPAPTLQAWIADAERGKRYRVDLLFEDSRLVVEADGKVKYTAPNDRTDPKDALWAEKRREARLQALGYRVERVLWDDVTKHWPATAARLRAALAR